MLIQQQGPIVISFDQPQIIPIRYGITTAVAVGVAAVTALAADPTRRQIIFINAGITASNVNILVYQEKDVTGANLAPTFVAGSERGGIPILPGAQVTIEGVGVCGGIWKAIASAANGALTIMSM